MSKYFDNVTELAEFLPVGPPVVSKPQRIEYALCTECGWKHATFEACPDTMELCGDCSEWHDPYLLCSER